MPKTLLDWDGKPHEVEDADVQYRLDHGWSVEDVQQKNARLTEEVKKETYEGLGGQAATVALNTLSGMTGGGSDAIIRGLGGGRQLREFYQRNPGSAVIGQVAGTLMPTGVGGLAAKAGAKVGSAIKGTSTAAKLARAGATATTEGVILGGGQGVSELALSDHPLTAERIASVMGSNVLLGGATGGALGVAGKGLGMGLERASGALKNYAAKGAGEAVDIAGDIAKLDAKGLRAAEKAELESIEAARIPKRSEIADEVKALRAEMKESKIWLATKDADVKAIKEVREVGKVALEADKSIDRMLRNPKALAERPQRVLDGLQQQEHALEKLIAQGDNLRPIFAKDASGARQAAFDYASTALEKNRALQAKIGEVTGKASSPRLEQILDARAGLSATKETGGIMDALGVSAMGHAVGALAGIPYVGQAVLAAKAVGGVVKKLGGLEGQAAKRASQAVDVFLTAGKKAAQYAPVIATKTLANVAFAPRDKKATTPTKLPELYAQRVAEVRSHVVPGPDGKLMMRPESRDQIGARLAPVRAANPLLADKIEATHARGVVFLADKAPKKPDPFGMQLGGKDRWQPSDMQMRQWARYVDAVNDPAGVVERLAKGSVTPEDAETMREVYPEMYADIQRQIVERLGELKTQLPYQKRLAMSVFSGVAVDPVLDPRVLSALQASFRAEPGTEGGTQAPTPRPAFGSVSKPEPTPAQERAG